MVGSRIISIVFGLVSLAIIFGYIHPPDVMPGKFLAFLLLVAISRIAWTESNTEELKNKIDRLTKIIEIAEKRLP